MDTKSKKGLIFKSLSFVFCAIFFAFAMVVAGSMSESKAGMNHCFSGDTLYVQDDGGCDLGDWNSMSVTSSASSYSSYGQDAALNLNGVQLSQLANSNGNFLTSAQVKIVYIPYGSVITYNEADHCTGNKKVVIHRYYNGASSATASWTLDGNGSTLTVNNYATYVVMFYGTDTCNIFSSGSNKFYNNAAIIYIVSQAEYATSNSVSSSGSAVTHPTDTSYYVYNSSSIGWYRYYLSDLPVIGGYFQYYSSSSGSWTTYGYLKSDRLGGYNAVFGFEVSETFSFASNNKYRFRMVVYTAAYDSTLSSNYNYSSASVTLYSSYFYVDTTAPSYSSYSGGSSSWATSRTVTISGATDATAGLHSSAYCFITSTSTSAPGYGSCSWQSSASKTYSSTYNGYAHAYIRDRLGNVKYASYQQIKVDTTAPTYSAPTGGSSTWVTSRTITRGSSAADAHSGLSSTPYCYVLSTSTSAPGTSSCSWTSSTSSTRSTTYNGYIHVYLRDAVGNISHTGYGQVRVDTTTPTFSAPTGGSSTWVTSRTITRGSSAADAHSGLNSTPYCYVLSTSTSAPGSSSCSWTSSTSSTRSSTYNGYIHVYLKDVVGNISYTGYGQVKVDTTAPTGNNVTGGSSSWATSRTLSVANGADAHSGLASSAYCFYSSSSTSAPGTGSCSWQSSSSKSYTSTTNTYVHAYIKDAVGKTTYLSYQQVKVDVTAPTGNNVTGGGSAWATSRTLSISSAADAHSGLNSSAYCFVSASSTTAPGTGSCSWQSSSTKSYTSTTNTYIHAYIRDALGNTKYASYQQVKVDVTNPTGNNVTGGGSAWAASRTLSISSGADAHSGLNSSAYCFYSSSSTTAPGTGSCSWQSASTKSYTSTVNTYVHAYIRDALGNYKYLSYQQVKVDTTKPTATITDKTIDSAYINLSNRTVTVPFNSLSDSHSGLKSITATNTVVSGQNGTCSTTSKNCIFNFDAISATTIKFKFTVTDNVGNTTSDTSVTISVAPSLDDIAASLKTLFASKLNTDLGSNGTQLSYKLGTEAANVLNDLTKLGLDLANDAELKYVFMVGDKSTMDLSNTGDLRNIAKSTTLSNLKNTIKSPVGMKNSDVSLILFIGDNAFYVNKGTIGAAAATALSSTFETYESTETGYVGAGLGEDGTVVSFSDDTTTSMAVTLGASNMIEKRDVYGNLEWEKAITSSGKIELKKVINNEYGILVLGETTSGSINGTSYPLKGGKDILVIRLDKQGNILFTNVIGTKDNDLVIAGDMNDNRIAIISSINDNQASLITMNVDGTGLNINTISSTGLELTSVAINANKVVVTGTTRSESIYTDGGEMIIGNVGEKDAFVLLYTDNSLTWARRLGGVSNDTFYSVSLDNNNIYIVGQSNSAMLHDNLGSTKMLDVYGNKDAMVVKYDYNGNLTQFSIIGGEGDDTFNQVLVTAEKVIVAGKSSSTYVTASHYNCGYFKINKLGELDTVIVTMDKSLIIEEGLNLSGDEADLVQEIGINQYTEQLMILSSNGVHTQKVVENTLDFDVTYINGVLKVKANEEIATATVFDGTNYYDLTEDGINLAEGVYEIKVTSASGQTYAKNYTVEVGMTPVVKANSNILPMVSLIVSAFTLAVLTVLLVKRNKKVAKMA